MTFTLTKDEQFIRVVAGGSDTYQNRDQLKQLGFKWNNGAWREMKLASDDDEIAGHLAGAAVGAGSD